jgi:L-ascorbate metabolism protein UlaG (beta-lactamase superfamily)
MLLTKYIHSCVLIDHKSIKILFDPGSYCNNVMSDIITTNIDYLILTHTHSDHYDKNNIEIIIDQFSNIIIIGNNEVVEKLKIDFPNFINIISSKDSGVISINNKIIVTAFDTKHLEIWKEVGQVQNTGYLIDNYYYNPADSFEIPLELVNNPPQIALLPVAGPPIRVANAIQYAIDLKATKYIAVHDGTINGVTGSTNIPAKVLPEYSIDFIVPVLGTSFEI